MKGYTICNGLENILAGEKSVSHLNAFMHKGCYKRRQWITLPCTYIDYCQLQYATENNTSKRFTYILYLFWRL